MSEPAPTVAFPRVPPMPAVWRILPLVLGTMFATAVDRAQTAALPPIFAPRSVEPAPLPARPPQPTLLSERMRSLINAAAMQAMAEGKFASGLVAGAETDGSQPVTSGGVMMMRPMVVRALPLRERDVYRPEPELMHFTPTGADGRRIAGGATMPLFHRYLRNAEVQVDFNVVNGAGKGVDHNRDFTRAEISFTFKW